MIYDTTPRPVSLSLSIPTSVFIQSWLGQSPILSEVVLPPGEVTTWSMINPTTWKSPLFALQSFRPNLTTGGAALGLNPEATTARTESFLCNTSTNPRRQLRRI